jgi:hypothetical protein
LYTNGTTLFTALFWAKDRLWAVDSTNTVWQMAPNPAAPPVALAPVNKVFQASFATGQWSLADTPGAVMIGNGNIIYACTPDTSGTVPTMTYPYVAATLPTGELILGMAYALNAVVLVTTAGLRVAELTGQSSNGLAFGPLLVKQSGAAGCASVAGPAGDTVCCVVGGVAYRVNLAHQVGTTGLEFAYTRLGDPAKTYSGTCPTVSSYSVFTPTTLYKIQTSGGPLATGQLQSGFHRFQTLEDKKYESVSVRAKGNGGTIIVSSVLSDGTVQSLYTMDLTHQTSVTVGLAQPTPLEIMGLQFDLAPSLTDNTNGPTLLGYQLKALPAPKRNRMIRVPLLMTPTTGHAGFGWSRLAALEALEVQGGTVVFKDYRTGETAEAFIESIEFKGSVSPSAKSEGWGGVAYLTLRKLS